MHMEREARERKEREARERRQGHTVVQAEVDQWEAPQLKHLHPRVLHIIRGHEDGQGGQMWGSLPAQQAVESGN
jgi:hypothetical protein